MATEVMRMDPSGVDGDCDTSGTETRFAGNAEDNSGKKHAEKPDDPGSAKKRNNQNSQHHRRKPSKKKRKWKPYCKMTWEEKKEVEERERIRADRIYVEMMGRGRAVAPFNTTQFIMAEHDPYEEDSLLESAIDKGNSHSTEGTGNDACSSKSSTSGAYSAQLQNADSPRNMDDLIEAEYTDSPHMAPEFISQDFSEAYERVQEESLSTMSRNDLVKEHLSLERNLSFLQEKLAEEKGINNSYSVKVQNIEQELESLRSVNKRLVRENLLLRYGEDAVKEDHNEDGIFQTSDCEYEAPHSDNDGDICYSDGSNDDDKEVEVNDDKSMDGVNCEDQCDVTNNQINTGSNEAMLTSSNSTGRDSAVASLSVPSDLERHYEADDALSEELDTRSKEFRKKRRNQKERDLALQHRRLVDETNSSIDEDNLKQVKRYPNKKKRDQANKSIPADDDCKKPETVIATCVRTNEQNVDSFNPDSHLIDQSNVSDNNKSDIVSQRTCEVNSSLLKDSKVDVKSSQTKVRVFDEDASMPSQPILLDSMEAESYSWDEKRVSTATMETLSSDDN